METVHLYTSHPAVLRWMGYHNDDDEADKDASLVQLIPIYSTTSECAHVLFELRSDPVNSMTHSKSSPNEFYVLLNTPRAFLQI